MLGGGVTAYVVEEHLGVYCMYDCEIPELEVTWLRLRLVTTLCCYAYTTGHQTSVLAFGQYRQVKII